MPQRDRRDIESALERKGFREDPCREHHRYFIFYANDGRRTPIKTHTSRGSKAKTIADNLLGCMARQCALTTAEFLALVDCPMSREAYEAHLIARERL